MLLSTIKNIFIIKFCYSLQTQLSSINPMNLRIALVIMSMIFSSAAFAQLEIKGIQVDKAADCQYIASLEVRSGKFMNSCERNSPEFFKKVSFLDKTADMWVMLTPTGLVKALSVSNFEFDKAFSSLSAKFGEGKVEKSTIQNRMGAKFEQTTVIWIDGAVTLKLSKHGARINEPSLMLVGEEWLKESNEKSKPSTNL